MRPDRRLDTCGSAIARATKPDTLEPDHDRRGCSCIQRVIARRLEADVAISRVEYSPGCEIATLASNDNAECLAPFASDKGHIVSSCHTLRSTGTEQ